MSRGKRYLFLAGLFVLLVCAGCAPVTRAEQVTSTQMTTLESRQQIGQSLVANYDGLTAVDVYLDAGDLAGAAGELRLYLRDRSEEGEVEIAQAVLPFSEVANPGFYRFSFPAIKESALQPFTISIELTGAEKVQLALAPASVYPDGSLYIDNRPVEGQLTFQLAYDPWRMVLGLVREFSGWLGMLVAAGFLFILPGWALLAGTWKGWLDLRWPEKMALAVGPGLALYPILFLWTSVPNWSPGPALAWGPPILAILFLAWRNRKIHFSPSVLKNLPKPTAPDLVLLAVILLILVGRFFAVRELPAPLWGDSLQHATMAQLMVDQGGLFRSWQPYAAYQSLTVQFGFSSGAAVWMWGTGAEVLLGTLTFAQVLNLLSVLALYPLAMKLSRGSRWAGVAAVTAGGLLSYTPAIYLNWGRFAQLFGQAVLPSVIYLVWHTIQEQRTGWKAWVVMALTIAGMVLGYYRMAFFFLAFMPGLVIFAGTALWKSQHGWRALQVPLPGLIITAVLAFILISPWFPNIAGSNLADMAEAGVTQEIPTQNVLRDYERWLEIFDFAPLYLLIFAAGSLLLSWIIRRWEPSVLLVWFLLVTAFPLGMLVNMPGANLMGGNFTVIIALYLPISLLAGWGAAAAGQALEKRLPSYGAVPAVSVFLILAALWGFYQQRGIGNEIVYRLVTFPDIYAMNWIRAHVPEDTRFLVEGFRVHRNTTVVGSDAGWWLPLVTKRMNTIPPQYALLNEQPEDSSFTKKLLENVAYFEENTIDSPEGNEKLCDWGITHIYVGQQQGLASFEKVQLFSPEELQKFPLIYAQDRVRIYEFPRESCPR